MPYQKITAVKSKCVAFARMIIVSALFFPLLIKAQNQQRENGFRYHAGISALPVFDALNLYPENSIHGAAIMGNFGCFLHPRISFGINPYYAEVSNAYPTPGNTPYGEKQEMTVYGLNSYVRAYIFSRTRFSVFMLASGGIGAMKIETTDFTIPSSAGPISMQNLPVASLFAGVGLSWNFTPWLAAEANLPFVMFYKMDGAEKANYFNTVMPTVGLQVYWQRKQL